jgi:hypothetical protein
MRNFFRSILKYFSASPLALSLSAVSGICLSALVYINYFQLPLFSKRYFFISGLIALISTLAIIFVYNLWLKPIKNTLPSNKFRLLAFL